MSQTEVQLIKDASIVNADISNSAAIDVSKISGALPAAGGTITGDVTFDGETAGRDIVFDRSDNALEFADDSQIRIGTGNDLTIFHESSSNFNVFRQNNALSTKWLAGSDTVARFMTNGAVELYHDNTKRFETTNYGASTTGTFLASGNIKLATDTGSFFAGAGDDLEIKFDGANSFIKDSSNSGGLVIQTPLLAVKNAAGSENMIVATQNGAVQLMHNNTKTFETSNEGVTFDTNSSSCVLKLVSNNDSEHIIQAFNDDLNLKAPSGGNVGIQANGNVTVITAHSTGHVSSGDTALRTNFYGSSSGHRPHIQFSAANDNNKRGMSVVYGQAGSIGPYLILGKHRSNSANGNTACAAGDELGLLSFQGNDGTNFKEGARIEVKTDNTVSSGVIPAKLRFLASDSSGNLQHRGTVQALSGVTGMEHFHFVHPTVGSTDGGSTVSNPVLRFNAAAFNFASSSGDFASFSWNSHWRHRAYADVGFWYGESGNASGTTYNFTVSVQSAASGVGYTQTNHSFTGSIGTFSNGKMRKHSLTSSWPTHAADRFVQGTITFTKVGSGISLQYMGMRVVEYTNPA